MNKQNTSCTTGEQAENWNVNTGKQIETVYEYKEDNTCTTGKQVENCNECIKSTRYALLMVRGAIFNVSDIADYDNVDDWINDNSEYVNDMTVTIVCYAYNEYMLCELAEVLLYDTKKTKTIFRNYRDAFYCVASEYELDDVDDYTIKCKLIKSMYDIHRGDYIIFQEVML